ncbi:MAG: hypothetical protein R3E84_16835 [Pseudomonadales bacterium]
MVGQYHRQVGAGIGPDDTTATVTPRWFLISEDQSLSLRLVSGAVLCEGDNGQLVVSPDDATHAARFDVVDGELWLSCLAGAIRVDGKLISHHHRISAGAQLQIGITRYFVGQALNDRLPDIPVLDSRLEPGDTRLPRPPSRHMPVFYEGPLDVEEIVITEALDGTASAERPPATPALAEDSPPGPKPQPVATSRTWGPGRARFTLPLLAGLGAALAYGAYNLGPQIIEFAAAPFAQGHAIAASEQPLTVEPDDGTVTSSSTASSNDELAYLVWVEVISADNHRRIVELLQAQGSDILAPASRDAVTHYAERLARIDDPDTLEPLVVSFGSTIARFPEFRDAINLLESRIFGMRRNSREPAEPAAEPIRSAIAQTEPPN